MRILFLLFFISGIAGLVYEIVWMRQLELVFGGSTPAVSTVLTAFMGGLALGSGGGGRLADRWRVNPVALYGLLELGVAATALLVPHGTRAIGSIYLASYGIDGPGVANGIVRVALTIALLIVPTTLMGATFPVMVKAVSGAARSASLSREIGWLYGINTLGAVAGASAAGFILLPAFGNLRTTFFAVAANVIAGVSALLLSRGIGARFSGAIARPDRPVRGRDGGAIPVWMILIGVFLTGFAALACEVVWSRVLTLVLASSIFSVTTMLAAFLLGIGAGSIAVAARGGGLERRVPYLLMALGLFTVLTIPLVFESTAIFGAIMRLVSSPARVTWEGILLGRFGLSLAILFIPAALSGALFPVLVALAARGREVGGRVGLAYAVNTIGASLGSLAAGFFLIPLLGTQRTVLLAGALLLGFGIVVMLRSGRKRSRTGTYALVAAAAVVFLLASLSHGGEYYLGKLAKGPKTKTVYYEEGVGASVIILEDAEDQSLRLYTNGTFAVDTSLESQQTVAFLGHLPALFAQGRESALVIGFGMGTTLAAVASHPFQNVTCVEIVPGVYDAAPLFARYNFDVLNDERVRKVVDDGRSHLAGSARSFDVITCDPIHPAFGSPALYTREYYQICRDHLSRGGVMAQYLPLHQLSADDFRLLLRTFSDVFEHCAVFLAVSHGVLIGSASPLLVGMENLEDLFAGREGSGASGPRTPAVQLERVGIETPWKLLSCMALDPACVRQMRATGPVNTDDHATLEFSERRSFGRTTRPENLRMLLQCRVRHGSVIEETAQEWPASFAERLAAASEARRHLLASRLHYDSGDQAAALEELRLADRASPGDPEIRRLGGTGLGYAHYLHAQSLVERWEKGTAAASRQDLLDEALVSLAFAEETLPDPGRVAALRAKVESVLRGPPGD